MQKSLEPNPQCLSQQWSIENYGGYRVTPMVFRGLAIFAEEGHNIMGEAVSKVAGLKQTVLPASLCGNSHENRRYGPLARKMLDAYVKLGVDVLTFLDEHATKVKGLIPPRARAAEKSVNPAHLILVPGGRRILHRTLL